MCEGVSENAALHVTAHHAGLESPHTHPPPTPTPRTHRRHVSCPHTQVMLGVVWIASYMTAWHTVPMKANAKLDDDIGVTFASASRTRRVGELACVADLALKVSTHRH